MEVRLIENKELLESVELFKIENLLWGTEKIAKLMGILDSFRGRIIYQTCVCGEESSPDL